LRAHQPRCTDVTFRGKPTLATPLLTWQAGEPVLSSRDEPIYLLGTEDLQLPNRNSPDGALLRLVAGVVPPGTAIALVDGTLHIALPEGTQ